MTRHSRTKLVPLEMRHEEQSLETVEVSQTERPDSSKLELDIEMSCPRCSEIMELQSSFDKLMYVCDSCRFLLKYV